MASLLGRINEETPKFDLLKKAAAGYEIRRYHRQLRASVTFDDTASEGAMSQKGFRQLAGYIFGGNKKRVAIDKNENESIAMTSPVMTETNTLPPCGSDKIAMTAPVMTDSDASKKTTTMSFILPSKYQSVEDLPVPNDSSVKIEVIEPYTVAALQFSGRWTPEATDVQTKRLLEMLRDDKEVKLTVGESKVEPKIARYNPPWTLPFLRTNEVMIPVIFTSSEA